LIQRLHRERSSRVILVGGPGDREITNSIIQIAPDCLDATDLSFGDMASISRQCNLFIGNDRLIILPLPWGYPVSEFLVQLTLTNGLRLIKTAVLSSNPSNATPASSMKRFQSAHTFDA